MQEIEQLKTIHNQLLRSLVVSTGDNATLRIATVQRLATVIQELEAVETYFDRLEKGYDHQPYRVRQILEETRYFVADETGVLK